MNKIKYFLISIMLFTMMTFFFSCDFLDVNKNVETEETESIFIPVPANQFALDKETETSAIEETKAHHIYDENFRLSNDHEIVIGDKQFLTKIDYIKKNADKFKNSEIVVEGMYGIYKSWDETFTFPMVYRNGPGCCGDDQYGGFYLINMDMEGYAIDDWLSVSGKPFIYEHVDSEDEKWEYLFLLVDDIKVLTTKERKAEMVNN